MEMPKAENRIPNEIRNPKTEGRLAISLPIMSVRLITRRVLRGLILVIGVGFIGFLVYAALDGLRPKDVSKMKPQGFFSGLVCDPMPASVTNLQARGTIGFTGQWVEMTCEIAPRDFEGVLTNGHFVPVTSSRLPTDWFHAQRDLHAAAEGYQKQGGQFDGAKSVYLMTTAKHDQLFIRYLRQ
jgi:hypothetical protein